MNPSHVLWRSHGAEASKPLSELVWQKYHPRNDHTQRIKISSSPNSGHGRSALSSRQRGTYERELINRRSNILGDGFLDVGDNPGGPIQVTISLASSELLGPEISLDESVAEIEIPLSVRRNFVSLRGLSSSFSQSRNRFINHAVSTHIESAEAATGLEENREYVPFFVTNDTSSTRTDIQDLSLGVNTQTTLMENHKRSSSHVIPSPWEGRAEDETTSNNKGTSPLQDGCDPHAMISEIKVYQRRSEDRKEAPKYPFETGSPKSKTSSRSSIHNGLLRSHRLQNFSQPSVVSSTQQLLCLTPSRGGVITLGSQNELKRLVKPTESNNSSVHVKRFNENESKASKSQATTVVTKITRGDKPIAYRLMQRDTAARPRTSATQGHPFLLSNLHYKHTTQIRQPYRYSVTPPSIIMQSRSNLNVPRPQTGERNLITASTTRLQPATAYRLIENHIKWNRKPLMRSADLESADQVYPYQSSFNILNPASQARKMAPVLRVVPALPRTAYPVVVKKPPKSPIETEPVSQKRVRFSDQIGLPLVRNATPIYRRKHSYILRWLETAGRPAKSIGLPLA